MFSVCCTKVYFHKWVLRWPPLFQLYFLTVHIAHKAQTQKRY
ncbi:hypothetical protein ES332_A10G100400v1 [Gossypium tomentosum]|uniref:Uncharacterized protein n=1 Tax=Gossypium tomentosum TaxID=34277 RepID=A0A5D2NNW3_GOSTO|nr:hypothetical protein ES332_A10G100400v1 [Gossypium tomentosum]